MVLTERREDMEAIARNIREDLGLQKAKLCFQEKRGYHLVIPTNAMVRRDFPNYFISVHTGNRIHRFSTPQLESLNVLFHEKLQEVWQLTELELGGVLDEIMHPTNLSALHHLCDTVALLDCLVSFVTYASCCAVPTTRPKLRQGGPVALNRAHHPVLLRMNSETSVPNDIVLDETSRLHVVTGRNMSGKSTFIRMVAVMSILAHTGCRLPAKGAFVRLLSRITTKLSNNCEMMQNESHFSREMRDMARIFKVTGAEGMHDGDGGREEATGSGSTLVVIDEVGRSTSIEYGFAFAYAIGEQLANKSNVLTLFVTHFHGVGALAKVNPLVHTFHLQTVTPNNGRENADNGVADSQGREGGRAEDATHFNANIKFTYKIHDGDMGEEHYGLETARVAGYPEEGLRDAELLREQLTVRHIATADDVVAHLIKPTAEELEYVRKMQKVAWVAQQLSAIELTAKSLEETEMRKAQLRARVTRRGGQQGGVPPTPGTVHRGGAT